MFDGQDDIVHKRADRRHSASPRANLVAIDGRCAPGPTASPPYPVAQEGQLRVLAGGRYELRGILGSGGAGVVYEAWDTVLGRALAIKQLPIPPGSSDTWLREAQFNASLRHPGFVVIFEVWSDGTHGNIAMELVRGRTLSALLAEGKIDQRHAGKILAQACDTLHTAHAAGVVHGDVKPSNMMLDDQGRLRILDFGIAQSLDPQRTLEDPHSHGASGTLAYMAPEQLLGAPRTIRSDIYSLGLVLQELLCGRRQHGSDDLLRIAHRKLHQDSLPERPSDVAPEFFQLIMEMTRQDPLRRIASMAQVRERIESWLAEAGPVSEARVQPMPRRWGFARVLTALGVGMVLLAAAIAYQQRTDSATQATAPDRRTFEQLHTAETMLRDFDEPGAIDRAESMLQEILEHEPDQAAAAATLAIAQCLQFFGDRKDVAWLKRAEISAQLALRSDDQLATAHAAHAWVLESKDEFPAAEASYQRALQLDPRNFHALHGYSRLLMRLQRLHEAQELLQSALSVYAAQRVFLDAMGTVLFRKDDIAGAESMFRASIAAKPTSVYGYANLSGVLLHANRTDEALAVLQQGLSVRPHGRLYNNLGTILFANGRYLEAAEAFERSLSSDKGSPNDYLKWANLGDALRWVPGRQQDARAAYTRALQLLDPGDAAEKDAVTYSRAGLFAARIGDERALAWTAAALSKAPESADVNFRAALVFETVQDDDRAIELLRSAVGLGYPVHLIESEPDLQRLRRDRRYHQMMSGGKRGEQN